MKEVAIRAALASPMTGLTAVARRLSALGDFDLIIVLVDGRIAQDGSPKMLIHKEGFHRELLKRESISMSLAVS